jgi:hypothetical protein
MNENAELISRHWRESRKSLAHYMGRFDGRRFDGLVKLVVSVHRRALDRQIASANWNSGKRAA